MYFLTTATTETAVENALSTPPAELGAEKPSGTSTEIISAPFSSQPVSFCYSGY